MFLAACLLVVIVASLVTTSVGFSPILGALIAGIVIAETEYRSEVEVITAPFRGLGLGIFLITVGMSVDLKLIVANWQSVLTAVAAVLLCAAIFSLKVYQQPEAARVATQSPLTLSVPVNAEQEWNLASPVSTQIFRTQPLRSFRESAQTHRATPPRYVLDSVPVSYEPTFRF